MEVRPAVDSQWAMSNIKRNRSFYTIGRALFCSYRIHYNDISIPVFKEKTFLRELNL